MQNSGPDTAKGRKRAPESTLANELAQQRKEAARADAVRQAVSASATDLLRSLAPDQAIPQVLERIGRASGVSRIQLYHNVRQSNDRVLAKLLHEWNAPGISSPEELLHTREVRWERDRLVPFLAKGEAVSLLTRDVDQPFHALLTKFGVKSVLLMPIFVDGEWWGQMGFDDCVEERLWSAIEIDTMKTTAALIGAAVGRARDLSELSDASRIIENSPVLLYRLGAEQPYPLIYISRNASRYGYAVTDLLKSPTAYMDVFHPEDRPDVVRDTALITSGYKGEVTRECRIRTTDGRYVWVETHTRGLYDDDQKLTAIEGILIDIDGRKTAEAELARFSLTDPVTGLANRKAFMNELGRAFLSAQHGAAAFAIHYIDLDRFKDINDVLGHSKGDELLKAVGERLTNLSRSNGDLVARFGGDEFAILQTAVSDPSDAGAFAARILRELAEPYALGTELHVTASIGISVFSREVAGPEEMIKQADVALYRAKDLGRNQFHFHSEELDTATIERVMLGGDLRRGLDRGELEVYYQPQVEIGTGKIVGLEALARWRHPKLGLLYPYLFIPIAEKTGTILALGRWMIEAVCRQIVQWRQEKLSPPRVAINVSAAQFKTIPAFDREVAAALARAGLEPGAIELELTESVLMETTREHGEIIDRLRALGVSLAIDDFGTGYSSLSYLRAYHVNHLKIAQEFVRQIQEDTGDIAIVRAAIGLGRELGIGVIAEGVETDLQLAILTEAGCRCVQGYIFSYPVPAQEAADLLRKGVIKPSAGHQSPSNGIDPSAGGPAIIAQPPEYSP